jgi:hypothetical protein
MCATNTSAITVPAPSLGDDRSAFVTAIIIVVEAFQEALAMRRAAQKKYPLSDE